MNMWLYVIYKLKEGTINYYNNIFRVLSDEKRLSMFILISKIDLCVCELVNIYKSCGFRTEGILKEHSFKNVKYTNLIIMGWLNKEM